MTSAFRVMAWLTALAVLVAAPCARGAEGLIMVLTGATGSVYYALGVALANAVGKALPGTKLTVQSTRASAENIALLQAARGEIAFALGNALSDAWNGNEEAGFRTPVRTLRGIAALYPSYIQLIARADSGVRTLADLKGKRISVGMPRSATERTARALLSAAGLTYKDFAKVEYLPFGESLELIKNRQIDVTLQSAGLGFTALRDLANALDMVVVPIPPEVVGNMHDPAYVPAVIPANTYRGQPADVPAVAVHNYLVTHEGVSNDTVYAVTKALWTGLEQLVAAHPAARAIDPRNALLGMPVPLHPGAERYYKETGLLK